MSLSMHRSGSGPILQPYRIPSDLWGGMLSMNGNVILLTFGCLGGALAIGWVSKTPRFPDRVFTLGRPRQR